MAEETGLRVGGWVTGMGRGATRPPPEPTAELPAVPAPQFPQPPASAPSAEDTGDAEDADRAGGGRHGEDADGEVADGEVASAAVDEAPGVVDETPGVVDLDLMPPAPDRYRGRRRQFDGAGTGADGSGLRIAATVGVVAAVGVVLIGSGVLANYLAEPVGLPVVPPTASASPSPSTPSTQVSGAPAPVPPDGIARPAVEPTPSPSPPPSTTEEPDPPPDPPEPVSLAFEAESAQLSRHLDSSRLRSASGERVVRLHGWCTCHTVRFPDVEVPRAGEYQLTIQHGRLRYEGRFSRTALVVVNDQDPFEVSLRAPRSGEVDTVTVTVRLREGRNTIQIGAARGGPAPNLDMIAVTRPD